MNEMNNAATAISDNGKANGEAGGEAGTAARSAASYVAALTDIGR